MSSTVEYFEGLKPTLTLNELAVPNDEASDHTKYKER